MTVYFCSSDCGMLLGFPLRHLLPYPAVVVLCLQSTAEEEPLLSQLSLPRASPLGVVQLVVPEVAHGWGRWPWACGQHFRD